MTAAPETNTPEIDADRLWTSLMAMAEIGKTPNGGSGRLALTEFDRQARMLLRQWCEAIGCSVSIDRVGNMFMRREGQCPELAPIAFGSHLDTQPRGGRFDGVLGVLAGLEALRTLHDHDIVTRRPLLLINWTNEEGSRFAPAMMASGVYAGKQSPEKVLATTDRDGISVEAALESIGFDGSEVPGTPAFERFFELHIEQGPILEAQEYDIGVVMGVQGMRWYDVTLTGQAMHAGTTPMALRQDALCAAARLIERLTQYALSDDPEARITFGDLRVIDASRNVVPGEVRLAVDLRHTDDCRLDALEWVFYTELRKAGEALGVTSQRQRLWKSPRVNFDEAQVESIEAAAARRGYRACHMLSGAGHDAVSIAGVCSTAMVFVPCRNGISHNEAEYASPEQCARGAQVLCDVITTWAAR